MSGSTPLAQGGLAVVTDLEDSFSAHARDTVVAAAGLADEERVDELVHSAPGVVDTLIRLGARFDTGSLGLEGGHSHRRIVHAGGDAIGAELHRVLRAAVLASDVEIMEHTAAIDLVTDDEGHVAGLSVGRVGAHGALDVGCIETRAVVLATGGYGQAFASSTNPADVTGDGLALAARAGARARERRVRAVPPDGALWFRHSWPVAAHHRGLARCGRRHRRRRGLLRSCAASTHSATSLRATSSPIRWCEQ